MKKLNLGFSRYSDSDLADKAEMIVAALLGNAKFPNVQALLPDITALIKALRDALALAGPGRAPAIEQSRTALEEALANLGETVLLTPGATDADFATTQFDLPKPRVRSAAPPPAPQGVILEDGTQSGEVVVVCEAVTIGGVRMYEAEWTLDPNNGPWNDGGSFPNSRVIMLTGMPRAKDIWVRVRVQGTNGPSAWSDPATTLVR